MFFTEDRLLFFKPLNGKYREMVVACVRALYARLHGPEADYNALFSNDDVRDMFTEVVAPLQILAIDDDVESLTDIEAPRTRANVIFRALLDTGWLERSQDRGELRHFIRFTRVGKLFTEAFVQLEYRGLTSRQRNVRNTQNALRAFLHDRDPFNLIDAQRYAEQVNSDLSEDIIDLHERKSALLRRAAEADADAFETYIEFMDTHFMPDMAVRMSADSVEKHRGQINELLRSIRSLPPEHLQAVNKRLAELAPTEAAKRPQGLVFFLLSSIESLVTGACRAKMPELRSALSGFFRRSRLVVSNAYAMASPKTTAQALRGLRGLAEEEANPLLDELTDKLVPVPPRLLNPSKLKLADIRQKREIPTTVSEPQETREDRLKAMISDRVQTAFSISVPQMEEEIIRQMGDDLSIRASNLQIHDVLTVLTLSHCIETGMLLDKQDSPTLSFEPIMDDTGNFVCFETPYGSHEDYLIRREKLA